MGGRADVADQVVQHQWIGRGAAVIGQHHVCLVLVQGLDVGDAQFFAGNAELAQAEIFGQGIVLAVGGAFAQGLDGRGPVVGLFPDACVVLKIQLPVEEPIDRRELLALRCATFALQHLAPGFDPPSRRAKGAVAFFG
ncbi:hypothetical protein D3C76_1422060 [compost metagenome]